MVPVWCGGFTDFSSIIQLTAPIYKSDCVYLSMDTGWVQLFQLVRGRAGLDFAKLQFIKGNCFPMKSGKTFHWMPMNSKRFLQTFFRSCILCHHRHFFICKWISVPPAKSDKIGISYRPQSDHPIPGAEGKIACAYGINDWFTVYFHGIIRDLI